LGLGAGHLLGKIEGLFLRRRRRRRQLLLLLQMEGGGSARVVAGRARARRQGRRGVGVDRGAAGVDGDRVRRRRRRRRRELLLLLRLLADVERFVGGEGRVGRG